MPENVVIRITERDLCWPLSDSSYNSAPHYFIKRQGHDTQITVDPYPGYAHSAALVYQELCTVSTKFPLPVPIYVYLPVFEAISRTNGVCYNDMNWKGNTDERVWDRATIILHGKRIPLHPGMTRYLISHEYGHAVQRFLEIAEGIKDEPCYNNPFINKYAELRKLAPAMPGDYRTKWHLNPQEVFANDFRILVMKKEYEFWPHNTVPRPTTIPEIVNWWEEKVEYALTVAKEQTQKEVENATSSNSSVEQVH